MGRRGKEALLTEHSASQALYCNILFFLILNPIIVFSALQMRNWVLMMKVSDFLESHSQQARTQDLKLGSLILEATINYFAMVALN